MWTRSWFWRQFTRLVAPLCLGEPLKCERPCCRSRAAARRRACNVPALPRVTNFSATDRAALALASVVVMRPCLMRLETRFASIALRCWNWRPSLAVRLRCRMGSDSDYRIDSTTSLGASSNSGSNVMPRDKPSVASFSLISFKDFLPKLRYLSISCSDFIANWPTVVMLALFRQLAARTLSSISLTDMLRSLRIFDLSSSSVRVSCTEDDDKSKMQKLL